MQCQRWSPDRGIVADTTFQSYPKVTCGYLKGLTSGALGNRYLLMPSIRFEEQNFGSFDPDDWEIRKISEKDEFRLALYSPTPFSPQPHKVFCEMVPRHLRATCLANAVCPGHGLIAADILSKKDSRPYQLPGSVGSASTPFRPLASCRKETMPQSGLLSQDGLRAVPSSVYLNTCVPLASLATVLTDTLALPEVQEEDPNHARVLNSVRTKFESRLQTVLAVFRNRAAGNHFRTGAILTLANASLIRYCKGEAYRSYRRQDRPVYLLKPRAKRQTKDGSVKQDWTEAKLINVHDFTLKSVVLVDNEMRHLDLAKTVVALPGKYNKLSQ